MEKRVTPFQNKVYEACREIPAGRVSTYAELARRVGCASPRAVGQALKCNPFAPEVPCHRVVASSRELGGFSGKSSGAEVARKKALLLEEGVGFEDTGKIKPDFVWKFSLAKCDSSA